MNSLAYSVVQDRTGGEFATLASMTRLGVLAASIAHEVNQPLTGIITNASTCLRMLAADPQTWPALSKPLSARFAMVTARRM